jgi:hypothetical protein
VDGVLVLVEVLHEVDDAAGVAELLARGSSSRSSVRVILRFLLRNAVSRKRVASVS